MKLFSLLFAGILGLLSVVRAKVTCSFYPYPGKFMFDSPFGLMESLSLSNVEAFDLLTAHNFNARLVFKPFYSSDRSSDDRVIALSNKLEDVDVDSNSLVIIFSPGPGSQFHDVKIEFNTQTKQYAVYHELVEKVSCNDPDYPASASDDAEDIYNDDKHTEFDSEGDEHSEDEFPDSEDEFPDSEDNEHSEDEYF